MPTLPTLSVAHEVRAIAPAGDAGLAWVRKRLDMARLSIDDVLSDRDAAPFHEILNDTQRLTDQIERLQAQLAAQQAVVDATRVAVSEYFDILEAQQREVLGDDAQEIIEEMEQSTTGTRRLAEARRTVYVLLGRPAQAAQPEGKPR